MASSRPIRAVAVFIFMVGVFLVIPLSDPAPAHAASADIGIPGLPSPPGIPSPCSLIPDQAAKDVCNAVSDPLGTATGVVGLPSPTDVVGGVTGTIVGHIVGPIINQLVMAEADGVNAALRQQVKLINSSTTPELTADWYLKQYKVILGMAIFVALAMLYLRLFGAVRNKDPAELGYGGLAFVVYIVVSGALPFIVAGLLYTCDDVISPALLNVGGVDATHALANLEGNLTDYLSSPAGGAAALIIPLIVLFIGVIGGILLAFELIFRDGMIHIMTAAEAVTLALWVHGRIGGELFRKCTMYLLGLISLKMVMAFCLWISLELLAHADGATPALLAAVVLLLVPSISWAYLRHVSSHDINAKGRFVALAAFIRRSPAPAAV